jgi:lipoprotein NlpI
MTIEHAPVPKPPVGLVLVLVAAGFLYALMLLSLVDLYNGGGDAMGRGIAVGFGFLFGGVLWLLLGMALLIAIINGAMPVWAEVAGTILWPLSGIAAFVALNFADRDRGGSEYLLVPALLPPLLATYALWARLPALQRHLPGPATSVIILGAIALVSLAPMPRYAGEQIERARERAAEREEAREEAANEAERQRKNLVRFNKLTTDSPLWDYAAFFGKDNELDGRAIAAAKILTHRQADAEEALRRGMGFPLIEYGRLDLEATPSFCAAAGNFLRQEAVAHPAPTADTEFELAVLPYLEADDMGAIEWLTRYCDIDDTVAQIRDTLKSYKPSSRDANLALLAWRRGTGFYKRGDNVRALADYNEAVRLGPGNEQFHAMRGDVFYDTRDYGRAIADYDDAIRLNPGYSTAYNRRGLAYHESGDEAHALQDYDKALELNSDFAAAHFNRGIVILADGDEARAIEDFDAAIRLFPRYAAAMTGRARADYYRGKYGEAAADLSSALALTPDEPYTVLWLYLARDRAGQATRDSLVQDAAKLDRAAWPWPVVAAYLGEAEPTAVLAASHDNRDQACEANFYFGAKSAAEGDPAAARPLLQQALALCPPNFIETPAVKSELAKLPP